MHCPMLPILFLASGASAYLIGTRDPLFGPPGLDSGLFGPRIWGRLLYPLD